MVDALFVAMAAVAVGGAVLALEAREIVYGAVALAASLFGVASLFFLLDAPYVAVFQIAVYVGAIAVLILFTVMLVRQERWSKELSGASPGRVVGALTAAAIALSLGFAVSSSNLAGYTTVANSAGFVQIGQLISGRFAPVLEVLALVLAAAVVGALTLSRVDREADES
jgi:NADH:ubiquinone oxidoreductase subunit 6 (subunit J)